MIIMTAKEETRRKKRKNFKISMWRNSFAHDDSVNYEENKEGIKRRLEKAGSYLNSSKPSDAAAAYELAAEQAAAIHDFRSAATYFTKASKVYGSLAKEKDIVETGVKGYWYKQNAMGELASAMRHEVARRKVRSKKSLLERLFSAIVTITIISFLGAIYFLSPNITGNIIGVSRIYSNWIGGVLFIVGLVGVFLSLKNKK